MKAALNALKTLLWRWRGPLVAAPVVALVILGARSAGLLQGMEWMALDQLLRARPAEGSDRRLAIVGIDDNDLKRAGKVTLPDGVYARAIEVLRAQQPRAIGLDIYRDLPIEPGSAQLKRVFETTPMLVGIEKVVGKNDWERVSAPPALKAKGQVGSNDLVADADGKIRRTFISVKNTQREDIYGFGLYLALLYLSKEGQQGIAPEPIDGANHWQLGKADVRRFNRNDGSYISADDGDAQIPINYRGPRGIFETVSLSQVLDGKLPQNWAKDRIILIGHISESSKDLFATPYSGGLLDVPVPVPGVEIHANVASQFVAAAIEGRPLITGWSDLAEGGWIFLWSTVGAALTWTIRSVHTRGSIALLALLGFGGAIAVLGGTAYGLMLRGVWIPLAPPLLALGGSAAAVAVYLARTANQIRETFGRYLNAEVVANLLENPEGLKMGGERRKITILTSDLRGFTATAERLPPEKVIEVLNEYLEVMADVIVHFDGTIDEFMGDGILVLFGAPTVRPDDGARAVACAVAMQSAMVKVNQKMRELGFQELEMGIGINTGEVVVGNIGSQKRTKYGVVGAQVNLTYRIESYTIGGQILITESALKEAGGESYVQVSSTKQVLPKGVQVPITIYDVGGVGAPYHLKLATAEEEFYALDRPLAIGYQVLDGKHVSETIQPVEVIEISERSAKLRLVALGDGADWAAVPAPSSNLKFILPPEILPRDIEAVPANLEFYAKVMADEDAEDANLLVRFTARSPALANWMEEIYDRARHAGVR